jgi:hypothetical protein
MGRGSENLRSRLAKANDAVAAYNQEKRSMQSLLQENSSKLSALQRDYDAARSERQHLERDKLAKEGECSTLQSDLRQSLKEIETVKAELAASSVAFSKTLEPLQAVKTLASQDSSPQYGSAKLIESPINPNKMEVVNDSNNDWYIYRGGRAPRQVVRVRVDATIISIPQEAFRGCSSMTDIQLPSSVTAIGDRGFYGCSALMSNNRKPIVLLLFRFCCDWGAWGWGV